jgi:antitoxin (DNA-binding transcriptional repressor) of toxin-antitoxin stability system
MVLFRSDITLQLIRSGQKVVRIVICLESKDIFGGIMNATIVDLRYKTGEILAALDKREHVTILYHGKPRATIVPLGEDVTAGRVREHEFFGMYAEESESVATVMESLRGGRYDL